MSHQVQALVRKTWPALRVPTMEERQDRVKETEKDNFTVINATKEIKSRM